eukprot:5140029-Prymnesium_polylepis.1
MQARLPAHSPAPGPQSPLRSEGGWRAVRAWQPQRPSATPSPHAPHRGRSAADPGRIRYADC